MAYNLGSVLGEIRIIYRGGGAEEAAAEVRRFKEQGDRAEQTVERLGNGLRAIGRIPILLGAAQQVVGLAGAIGPLLGLLAALPAAGVTVAGIFATVQMATQGVGEAMTAVAEGDAAALEEAMQNLAPSAQEFVRSYSRIKPGFDALQMDVQQAAFEGLGARVEALSAYYLPTLERGLTAVAYGLNQAAEESIDALMTPETVSALNSVLMNTEGIVADVGGAVGHLIAAIINMAGAGNQWLEEWTSGATQAASAFREWTASAEGQAQVNTWIEQGVQTLQQLWAILSNLGTVSSNVWSAMDASSGGMLNNLVLLTDRMAAWTASAEGQETLVNLFNLLHQVFLGTLDVLSFVVDIVGVLVGWFNQLSPQTQSLVAGFIAWGAALGVVLGWLAPLIGMIIRLVPMFMGVYRVLATFIPAMWTIIRILAIAGMHFLRLGAQMALAWIIGLGPIGWIIAAVVALVALIILNWEWVRDTSIAVWNTIWSFLVSVWNSISTWAIGVWNSIVSFFVSVWTGITTFWTNLWNGILAFVTPIWNTIVSVIQVAWDVIANIFRFAAAILLAIFFTIWTPIQFLIVTVWNFITGFLQQAWNAIVSAAQAIWGPIATFFSDLWNTISTGVQTAWNAVTGWLGNTWNGISSTASSTWGGVRDTVSAANDAARQRIQAAWDYIWSYIGPILTTIGNHIATVWNNITTTIGNALNSARNVITSVWNGIVSFFQGVWNTISGIFSGAVGRVMSILNGIWSQISGLAASAGNLLVSAGRNIVTGLWNGIAAMGNWLYGRIMGWVRSVVPGPILQFLGINSPSRYMHDEVGEQIPPGVAGGIEDKSSVAERAAAVFARNVGNAANAAVNAQVDTIPATVSLPPALANRFGALATSTANAPVTAGAVATASTPSAVSSSRSVQIGSLSIPVQGIIDPTDPVAWRRFGEQIQELLVEVEASYS